MANMAQAVRMALHYAEEHLGVTDIFGEDVGPPLGGVFTATQGLKTAWNTPLDERGIIGMAIGLAMAGGKPVAEIQFADYIFNTIDLLKVAGNTCWATNGDWNLPMVVKTPVGSGIRGSIYHSHSFDAMATHIPGWKIVIPSNPLDAYGLMISACQEINPVMYLEPKALLRIKGEERIPGEPDNDKLLSKMIDAPLGDRSQWKPQWPELEAYAVPIGKGKVVRAGSQVTVVSYGRTLPLCKKAADDLAAEGVDAEVIDMRTLWPYDWELIKGSVEKTGRVLYVNEDTEVTNFGEHLVRRTVEELFYKLMAPPRLLAGKFIPGIGLADALEMASVPQQGDITAAIRTLAGEQP
ncbi:alpha-ketoacid dehydrogenase subunit beta [Archangium violaceum]|uniref:3-methyl-2-oxobutanoate dehydrogenase n=1 Tax=Archangium violaceum Cb vi76 TaxID=1406225 RepID=A0A084SEZ2_9BACT|nr:transketolase C-terminal domain-containing protein [Archangium violaceum]KFA87027.1 3-methyl-2-oxobutanoate dehydrogenase [Archangium violaceum Cb vi76]